MDKIQRGKKHLCVHCDIKFYDLGKLEAECPKCGKKPEYNMGTKSILSTDASAPKSNLLHEEETHENLDFNEEINTSEDSDVNETEVDDID